MDGMVMTRRRAAAPRRARRAGGPIPAQVPNWVAGREEAAASGRWLDKVNPATGRHLCRAARSDRADIERAVAAARRAQAAWAQVPAVTRGEALHRLVEALRRHRETMAGIVALETGRSPASALGETDGAVALGAFMAGEGQRLYGRTTTSGIPNRWVSTVRQPVGVAGLIIAANTPIANIAWKVFPALICGNAAVLKAAEDAPGTAWFFGRLAQEAGLPPGLLDIVQGYGEEAGAALVAHPGVDIISFTGSTAVGRQIASVAGGRLARVSLELGGKNPLVVCDDADQPLAAKWVLLSAFSNAGQRCSSASRIIVFSKIYDAFRARLLRQTAALKVGPTDRDDFGPVISAAQLDAMVKAVDAARRRGARVLTGGGRLADAAHRNGFYMAPTLLEGVGPKDPLSTTELFGPIACLYRARDFEEALALANDSPYGLTACIHTRNLDRAMEFTRRVQAGVAVVNAGTHGSEPHLPFGGLKQSGNGTREPGIEALDVYSEVKNIYLNHDPRAT